MNNIDTVVMYHKDCNDGYIAALVMYAYLLEENLLHKTQFIPVQYGHGLPDEELLEGKTVYVLDFSFSKENTAKLADLAGTLIMLDHHEGAVDNLFTGEKFLEKSLVEKDDSAGVYLLHTKSVSLLVDKSESGASLAFDTFGKLIKNDQYRERLFYLSEHAKDRDLWNFVLPATLAVYEYCTSLKYDLELGYGILVKSDQDTLNREIEKSQVRVDMRNELANTYAGKAQKIQFMGYEIPVVNVPSNFSSIVGDILNKDVPFALMYVVSADRVYCSLRSNKETGVNVNLIANKFGGGGHACAAGFTISTSNLYALLQSKMNSEDYFFVDNLVVPDQSETEYESRPFTNLIIWLIIAMVSLAFVYHNVTKLGNVDDGIPHIKQSVFKEAKLRKVPENAIQVQEAEKAV